MVEIYLFIDFGRVVLYILLLFNSCAYLVSFQSHFRYTSNWNMDSIQ